MTDLQQMIIMLSKTKESFSKDKSGKGWKLTVTSRDVTFYFDEDGVFEFIYNELTK